MYNIEQILEQKAIENGLLLHERIKLTITGKIFTGAAELNRKNRMYNDNLSFINQKCANIKSPVGWSNRIHRLHLCRGVTPPPNKYPVA